MTDQEQLLDSARNALNSGETYQARQSLLKIADYQHNHEALYLLAVCHAFSNEFDKAEELFVQTIKLTTPTDALLGNLGLSQLHQNKFKEAIASYLRAIEINPNFYDALVNLSSSYDYLNNNELAVKYARKAQGLNRNNPVTLNILAKHAMNSNDLGEAITLYQSSLNIQPDLPQTYSQLSSAYSLAKKYKLAEDIIKQGLTRLIDNPELRNSLAGFYASRNRYDEAIEEFTKVISKDRSNTFALAALAKNLIALQKFERALKLLLNAYEEFPDSAEITAELSNYYQLHKDYESAHQITSSFIANIDSTTALTESIAISHSKSCKQLCKLDDAKEILETAISNNASTKIGMESLHYAYGDILDGLNEFDSAFSSYKSANDLIPRTTDIKYYERVLSDLVRNVDRSFLESASTSGNQSNLPVFIIGMPRSGTSLVEQIISSHPDAYGAGELSQIWNISDSICGAEHMIEYTDRLQNVNGEDLARYANDYLTDITALSKGESRITDKMPHNFMQLGLIECLFPNARIIHCQRHPFDTCLSIYFRKINENHIYARKLEDLGRFYKKYRELMRHWKKVSSLQILEVNYENMVVDQKSESEKIINHIGLDWTDTVLDYHQSDRIIMTPSAHQASKPIYTSSMHRWKNYQKYIGPLIEILGQPEQFSD